jgi:hypothetical protein
MRQIAEFVAVLSCGLFTGGSVYINLVEHPALYLAKGNLLSLLKKCLVGEICGSPLRSDGGRKLGLRDSVAALFNVCRLRSKVFFSHLKPCGIGNPRHPYQGRDRQRIPRLNAKSRNRCSALRGGEPAAIGGRCRVQRPAEVLPQCSRRL